MTLERKSWSWEELPAAMAALAKRSGKPQPRVVEGLNGVASHAAGSPEKIQAAVLAEASRHGLEAAPAILSRDDLLPWLRCRRARVLSLSNGAGFLALLPSRGPRLRILLPDLRIESIPRETVIRGLTGTDGGEDLDAMLSVFSAAGLSGRRCVRARRVLESELGGAGAGRQRQLGWILQLPPGAPFLAQLEEARLPRFAIGFVVSFLIHYGLALASWAVVGRIVLRGQVETGWLAVWALLLFSLLPFRIWTNWARGRFAIGTGILLKRRLLHGALQLDPEVVRTQGVGQFLARVLESEALESITLSAGFIALRACLELGVTAWVLSIGAGGWLQVSLLGACMAMAAIFAVRGYLAQRRWSGQRLDLTYDLVEVMAGHRTRLAQEPAARRHWEEDRKLEGYLEAAAPLDDAQLGLELIPRLWLLLGLTGLAPAFVLGSGSPGALAIGIGGIILAYRAFSALAEGTVQLITAAVAWEKVSPVFRASRREIHGEQRPPTGPQALEEPLLEAIALDYRFPGRVAQAVQESSLIMRRGDRILLRGPSGSGKSTLASLLSGIRVPDSGLLLLGGSDRFSCGLSAWRRQVSSAPQFHENHIFSDSFAFNLLMGRQWPPTVADLSEAEALCRQIGLSPLIEKMPGGMFQMVGETGWRLSHGERSRVFLARALLQRADLVILDESFAALDRETLRQALGTAEEHAGSLLVIAHP